MALVAAAVVLLLLLIFVLQNGARVAVSFLGVHATLPLGIALLLAAIAGVLIVAIPGTGRILQLRHLARQQTQQGQGRQQTQQGQPTRPPTFTGQPRQRSAEEAAADRRRVSDDPDTAGGRHNTDHR